MASSSVQKLYILGHLNMFTSITGTVDLFFRGTDDPGLSGVRINSLLVSRHTVFEPQGARTMEFMVITRCTTLYRILLWVMTSSGGVEPSRLFNV